MLRHVRPRERLALRVRVVRERLRHQCHTYALCVSRRALSQRRRQRSRRRQLGRTQPHRCSQRQQR